MYERDRHLASHPATARRYSIARQKWDSSNRVYANVDLFALWLFNQEVLDMVDENRTLMNTIQQRQKNWSGHVLRSESILRAVL